MGNVSLYKYRSGGGVMERLIKDGDGMCREKGGVVLRIRHEICQIFYTIRLLTKKFLPESA